MRTSDARFGPRAPRVTRAIRPGAILAVAGLAVVAMLAVTPLDAGAASNGLWSVFPSAPPGQPAPPFLTPELTPGTQSTGSVTVDNYTGSPLSVNLYAADAFNTAQGGLSLRRQIDPQFGIGRWLHLAESHLIVPPHSAVPVGYVIDTPRNATPGDHVGGIVAEDTAGTPAKAGAVPITVLEAVGVRVYARVRGPLHPGLSVSHLSVATPRPFSSQFGAPVRSEVRFTVRDSGNTVLTPTVRVRTTTPFGRTGSVVEVVLPQLLPGASVSSALTVKGVSPWVRLRTTVSVLAQGTRTTVATREWAVPWGLVALLALVLLLVVLLLWRRRRRRRLRRSWPPSEEQTADAAEPATVP
jgi:hypothetical protein